jgi:hypothetical protein
VPAAEEIAEFDIVALVRPTADAPAGARAGVLEILEDGFAMIEILEPVLGPAARIDFVPLGDLQLVKKASSRNGAGATS